MLGWGIAIAWLVTAVSGSVNTSLEFEGPLADKQVYCNQMSFGQSPEIFISQSRQGRAAVLERTLEISPALGLSQEFLGTGSVEVAPVFQPGPLFLMLLGVVSMLGRVRKPRHV